MEKPSKNQPEIFKKWRTEPLTREQIDNDIIGWQYGILADPTIEYDIVEFLVELNIDEPLKTDTNAFAVPSDLQGAALDEFIKMMMELRYGENKNVQDETILSKRVRYNVMLNNFIFNEEEEKI